MLNRCAFPACSNEGRYLTSANEIYCGIHDIEDAMPSVRVSDLPQLIGLVDTLLIQDPNNVRVRDRILDKLKEILCQKK